MIFNAVSSAAQSRNNGTCLNDLPSKSPLSLSNIIVRDKDMTDTELEQVRMKFSQGLSLSDTRAIGEIVPGVVGIAPQSEVKLDAMFGDKSSKATVIGVTPGITTILNYRLDKGVFITEDHNERQLKVCILGANIAVDLFNYEDPIGQNIKLGDQWFEVVGVLRTKAPVSITKGQRRVKSGLYINT